MMWGSYVALAGNLVEYKFEAAKRSAISRAYYGSFNVARRQLEEHGIPIENRRAHDQVWRTFRVRDRATFNTKEKWRTVGELGGALRALRNQADYADQVRMLDKQAVDAVDSAERIMVLLDELEFVD